jgi:hypothetical protein
VAECVCTWAGACGSKTNRSVYACTGIGVEAGVYVDVCRRAKTCQRVRVSAHASEAYACFQYVCQCLYIEHVYSKCSVM